MSQTYTLREKLLYFLTGTETPKQLSEREKVMVDKFLEFHRKEMENAINALKLAQPYVSGAYECAFPDEDHNDYVLDEIKKFTEPELKEWKENIDGVRLIPVVPLKFDELKENGVYAMYSKQFDVKNRIRLIAFDVTGLNRRIAYFQYVDRGHRQISKAELKKEYTSMEKTYLPDHFALWDFNIEGENATDVLSVSN